MTEAAPRPASTLCLFRAGTRRLLMVQRGSTAKFMASAWVFPGGAVDPIDHDPAALAVVGVEDPEEGPWVGAAVRELVEETGIWLGSAPVVDRRDEWLGVAVYTAAMESGRKLGGDHLTLFANWITPRGLPIRFDTRFYAATVDVDLEPDPDARELDDAVWIDVDDALQASREGTMTIPFPTRKTLEYLAGFADGDALVAHARSLRGVLPVLPKVRLGDDGSMGIVLPGEDGYDKLDHLGPDRRDEIHRLVEAARRGGRGAEADL